MNATVSGWALLVLCLVDVAPRLALAGERAGAAFEAELKKLDLSPDEAAAAADCVAKYREVARGPLEADLGDGVGSWAHAAADACAQEGRERLKVEVGRRERAARAAEAQAKADSEADEALAILREDPSVMLEYLSWRRCESLKHVEEANAAIAREKEKAKLAGVVDKAVLNDAAGAVVDWTKHIKALDGELKKLKAKALQCSAPKLKLVATCVEEDVPSSARCRAMQTLHASLEE